MYTNDKTLLKTNSGINIPSEFEDDETKLDNDLSENNKKEMSN